MLIISLLVFFRLFFDSPIERDRYGMGKHSHGLRIIKINHKDCWALQLNSFSMNEQHRTEKKPPLPNCDINYKLKALYMSDIIHIRIIWLCSHLLLFFPLLIYSYLQRALFYWLIPFAMHWHYQSSNWQKYIAKQEKKTSRAKKKQ